MAPIKEKDVLRWLTFLVNCILFPFLYFSAGDFPWAKVTLYVTFCVFNLFIINEFNMRPMKVEDIVKVIEAKKSV